MKDDDCWLSQLNRGTHGDRSVNFPSQVGLPEKVPPQSVRVGGGSMSRALSSHPSSSFVNFLQTEESLSVHRRSPTNDRRKTMKMS